MSARNKMLHATLIATAVALLVNGIRPVDAAVLNKAGDPGNDTRRCLFQSAQSASLPPQIVQQCFQARPWTERVLHAAPSADVFASACPATVEAQVDDPLSQCRQARHLGPDYQLMVNPWSDDFYTLSIKRPDQTWLVNGLPLAPVHAIGTADVTWLRGRDEATKLEYFVYLAYARNADGRHAKHYAVEIFDLNDSAACLAERPEPLDLALTGYACPEQPLGGLLAKQTGSGGGGEPPTGGR